jgi:hypothetical protein
MANPTAPPGSTDRLHHHRCPDKTRDGSDLSRLPDGDAVQWGLGGPQRPDAGGWALGSARAIPRAAFTPPEPRGVGRRPRRRRRQGRPGRPRCWLHPDGSPSSETLADLTEAAAASITRHGDWIEFGHDDEGDPKGSHQATAFHVAATGRSLNGVGTGWDGTIEPFGEPVEFRAPDHR